MREKKQVGIKRKCSCCGECLYLRNENIDDAIYYDTKTYHSSCFINMCNEKSQHKRKDVSKRWTLVKESLESIKKESYKHLCISVAKDNVHNFIRDNYDVTIVPTTIWQKLSDIYSGEFQGMIEGIPPEHLLDMWKRKIDMLNELANKNKIKGIGMNISQRISYDLSVLVNKYDSYLKWLEKQKIIEVETKQSSEIRKSNINKSIINTKANEGNSNQDNNDISGLVDDIFED